MRRPVLRIRYSSRQNSLEVSSIPRPARSTRSSFRSSTASTDSTGKWLRRIKARMRADSSVKENGFPK